MDVFSLPEVKYRVKDVNGSKYRIPCVEPGTFEFRIRNWQPKTKGANEGISKDQEDLDEPTYQICGIENPLAGVYDDDQDNQEYTEIGINFTNGIWVHNMTLSHHHHIHVFGKDFQRLKSLEKSASCKISIVDADSIVIESVLKANVLQAASFISDRAKTSKLRYTHFICFPLTASKDVLKTVDTIQAQVKDVVMRKSALKSTKLHFTVCMLKLDKDADVQKAKVILDSFQGCMSRKVGVELVGVQSVQDDARRSRVVYTGGRGGDNTWRKSLLEISAKLISQLEKSGLVDINKQRNLISPTNQVKLHATLFNSKYASGLNDTEISDSENDSGDESGLNLSGDFVRKEKRSNFFDSTSFIDKYKDLIFGSVDVEELRLCSLLGYPSDAHEDDGFYKTDYVVKL